MAKIRNDSPLGDLILAGPDGRRVLAKAGATVEFDDADYVRGLLRQEIWTAVDKAAKELQTLALDDIEAEHAEPEVLEPTPDGASPADLAAAAADRKEA